MTREKLHFVYRNSLVLIAFLIPSGFYGITFAVLSISFFCWIYFKDYKTLVTSFRQPQIILPVLMYLYVLGGFFFSNDFQQALSTISIKLPFLIFPLIIGTCSVVDKNLINKIGKAFIISTCLFFAIAIGYAIYDAMITNVDTVKIGESVYNKFSSYGLTRVFFNWHPTYVAMFANFSITILIQQQINRSFKTGSVIVTVLAFAYLTIAIFLLNSIIAILAYILALLFFIIKYLTKLQLGLFAKLAIVASVLGMSFSLLYINPFRIQKIETLKDREFKVTDDYNERNLLTMRLAKWNAHWDIIKEHWLLGTTEGDIKAIRKEKYLEKGYVDLAKHNYNAHNQYVEVMTVYGLVGFVIFMGMLLMPLIKGTYHFLFAPFLLVAGITFLTETVLNRQQGMLFFMFFYALLTNPFARDAKKQVSPQSGNI